MGGSGGHGPQLLNRRRNPFRDVHRRQPRIAHLLGQEIAGEAVQVDRGAGGVERVDSRPRSATVIPARTSPMPPLAMPGLPVGFTFTCPSGSATSVWWPFSTGY